MFSNIQSESDGKRKTSDLRPAASLNVTTLSSDVPEYFKSTKLNERITKMQTFLDSISSASNATMLSISDDEDDDDDDLNPMELSSSKSSRKLIRKSSSADLYQANSVKKVTMLQDSLDAAQRSYVEALKHFNEASETLDVLKESLLEAIQENNSDEKKALEIQIKEAEMDLDRVTLDRDQIATRCTSLREQLQDKEKSLSEYNTSK